MYEKTLVGEWIDWVETPNPDGTREREIFPYVRQWLGVHAFRSLLDVGCGQWAFSELVNGKTKYIGIDPSSILIERAQERYSSENRKFAIADAYEIPLMDDSMNAVMSVWVWSHLESPTKAAREMSRVLMEGGRFLIITANPETYEERKAFYRRFEIMENLLVGDFDLGNGKTLTNSTLYLHSREEIEEALRKAGLRIESATRMGISELGHQGWYLAYEGSVQK